MKTHLVWIQSDRCRGDRGRCRPAPGRRAVRALSANPAEAARRSRGSDCPGPNRSLRRLPATSTVPGSGRAVSGACLRLEYHANAPVAAYPQTAATYPTYPQTTAQYPAAPGANYYVANNQPTEARFPRRNRPVPHRAMARWFQDKR